VAVAFRVKGRITSGGWIKGLFKKERTLDRVEEWFKSHLEKPFVYSWKENDAQGLPALFLILHPAGEPVIVTDHGKGCITVFANTAGVGPGYHIYVCDLFHLIGNEIRISWDAQDETHGFCDDTGYFYSGDKTPVRDVFLKWLRAISSPLKDAIGKGAENICIGMPIDGENYLHGLPVTTVLGPRDLAWVERVADDPLQGIDIFPWWHENELGPHALLGWAQCIMWTEARWNKEVQTDATLSTLNTISTLLEAAYAKDPTLDYPWKEWKETLELLDMSNSPLCGLIKGKAEGVPADKALIGYRRGNVIKRLPGGWSITIPGHYVEDWEGDGRTFVAWGNERTIRFSSLTIQAREGMTKEDILAIHTKSAEARGEIIEYNTDTITSRGDLFLDEEEGHRYWILGTVNAVEGGVAILTIYFDDANDDVWAKQIWHSIEYREKEA
jgi:hypothetical protein